MGREIQKSSIRVRGHEVLCFLSGREAFYNLTNLWKASAQASNYLRSPAAYEKSGQGETAIGTLSAKTGVHPRRLIYFKDPDGWYASHPLAVSYAMWISPEFQLLVIEAASRWAEQAVAGLDAWNHARADGKVDRRHCTDTIKSLGIPAPRGMKDGAQYGIITNVVYKPFLNGQTAAEFKNQHGLSRKSTVREYLDPTLLTGLALAERAGADKLRSAGINDLDGAKVCFSRAAELVAGALKQLESERL